MPFGHVKSPSSNQKEKTFVESLKYKTMRVGMKILGVVVEVSERGLVLSLPNGLKGNVTRAEAGDAFENEKSSRSRKMEVDEDDEEEKSESSESESESDDDPSDLLSLQHAFHVGQLVRCTVNSLGKGKSGGKRIDLSTRVSQVTEGITPESLSDGVNVPAEVTSVEDHGFVLSFGIKNAPTGFLPRKAVPSGRGLVTGSILDVVLTGADRETNDDDDEDDESRKNSKKKNSKRLAPSKRNVLTVTADPKRVANAVTHESDTTSMTTLLPGMLVNARVKQVLADGLSVNFMTYFVAACDAFHVGDSVSKGSDSKLNGPSTELSKTHKVGERFRARVLFVDVATKRVGVSLRPHLIRYGAPEKSTSGVNNPRNEGTEGTSIDATDVLLGVSNSLPPIGYTCDQAVVRRVDASVGVLLELSYTNDSSSSKKHTQGKSLGYCHISDASDGHLEKLEKVFKVGSSVKCRVLGRRPVDGISTVSCRKSVIDQPFLTMDELQPGMKVRGEVVALEAYGAMVKLAPGVKALCPPNHISDIPGRTSSQKVKEGANLQFRVLSVDKQRRRVTVTHKKTLVKSELTVVDGLRSATVGVRCHGVVTGVEPYGVFVQLFGEARGLAGLQDLGLSVNQPPSEAYEVGQCVRCTVVRADGTNARKLKLSLIDGREGGGSGLDLGDNAFDRDPDTSAEPGPPAGTVFDSVVVKSVDTENGVIKVKLPSGQGLGTITRAHLSDCSETGALLCDSLTQGTVIGPVVVLESKGSKRSILSRKKSLVKAAETETLPESITDLMVGERYPGYVASVAASGVFVRFLGRLTGLAPPSGLTGFSGINSGLDPEDRFALGQTVIAKVTAVDATTVPPRVSLSLSGSVNSGNKGESVDLDASLVTSIFADIDTLDLIAEGVGDDADDGVVLSRQSVETNFRLGSKISVSVSAVKEYGALADSSLDENAVCLLANDQLPDSKKLKPGKTVECVVLDIDRREGVVDCGARPELMNSGINNEKPAKRATRGKKSETKKDTDDLKIGTSVTAVIELIKPQYVVVSLPQHGGAIGYCASRACNSGFGNGVESSETVCALGKVGTELTLTVASTSTRLLLLADNTLLGDTEGDGTRGGGGGGGSAHPVGAVLEATVREKQLQQLIVDLPGGGRGRVHATEMSVGGLGGSKKKTVSKASSMDTGTPVFDTVHEGDAISVVVCGPAGDRGNMLEVSARRTSKEAKLGFQIATDNGAGDGGNAGVLGTEALVALEHGSKFQNSVVTAVSSEVLAVLIAPGVTVRLPKIETSSNSKTLKVPLDKRFTIGAKCGEFTVLTADVARKKMTGTLRTLDSRTVKSGVTVPVIVTKILPNGGGVFCQVTGTRRARAHVCDLQNDVTTSPWKKFSVGDVVDAAVVHVSDDGGEIDVSFAEKDIKGSGKKDNSILGSLAPGTNISGYVKNVAKGGLFLAIARDVDARVKMCNLGDAFVDDPGKVFGKGSVVSGTVISVDQKSNNVEMTLRTDGRDASAARDDQNENLTPVEVGTVTMGTVRRVQTYGVFVTLDGSGRSGLCHISAFADAIIKDGLESHVRAGERVRVKVLAVDEGSGKISLGMKPSLFTDEDEEGNAGGKSDVEEEDVLVDEEEEDDDASEDEDEDEDKDEDKQNLSDSDADDALVDDDEMDVDEEDSEDGNSSHDDGEDDSDGDDSDDSDDDGSDSDDVQPMDDDGLDWDAAKKSKTSENSDDDKISDQPLSKREKAKKKANKELELYKKEQDLKLRADSAPETAKEFEKEIMGNPRSSFLWISYVALQVSLGAYDEARNISERAIKAIPSSDQDEKMNLWVAYLNLEYAHGKPNGKDAVGKLFQRAVQVANPKKLHLALAGTYERSGDFDNQSEVLKRACRKFSQSAKVWIACIRSVIVQVGQGLGDAEQIKKAIDQASQTLPKRKVVKVLVQVGLVEIREGNVERGRSMFESILRNYPRRTDIWSTYIDQEIKAYGSSGDPERCRGLLERATHLELSPKAMKFLFKRYLDFERLVGDKKKVEHVKDRAMEYVASKFG